MPRGSGKRCSGFRSSDGKFEMCSREELAGGIEPGNEGLYAHLMQGDCFCGASHGNFTFERDSEIEATYDYRDESGSLLFQVVRKTGKRFRQRVPDGRGGWEWKLGDVRRVLYKLPDLLADDGERPVYIPEGEKDVDTLIAKGCAATCNPGGAGKWNTVPEARTALAGRDVIIIADNDDVGRKHALDVLTSLQSVAATVRVVSAPAPYKDVTEMLQAGGKLADLVDVAEGETPAPPQDPWDPFVSQVTEAWYTQAPPARVWLLRDSRTEGSPGILPMGKVGEFIAEGGAGKTMLLTQLAVCVATGAMWLDTVLVERPGRVLLLLGEEDEEEAKRRLYRASRIVDRVPTDGQIVVLPLAGVPCPMIETNAKGDWEESSFLKWVRARAVGADMRLIIVDPLSRFAGKEAETDNAAGTRFIQALESIAVTSGATVLVTHHTNKLSRGPDGRVEASSGRGASSLVDGVRWQAALSGKVENGQEQVTLTFTKSNYSRKPAPILLRRGEEGALVRVPDAEEQAAEAAVTAAKELAAREREKAKRDAQEARQRARDGERTTRLEQIDRAVLEAIAATPGIGLVALRAAVSLRMAGGCRKGDVDLATGRLELARRIERRQDAPKRPVGFFPIIPNDAPVSE